MGNAQTLIINDEARLGKTARAVWCFGGFPRLKKGPAKL